MTNELNLTERLELRGGEGMSELGKDLKKAVEAERILTQVEHVKLGLTSIVGLKKEIRKYGYNWSTKQQTYVKRAK
jgi:hypothetical protein